MPDLFRPLPAQSRRQRAHATLAALGPRRLAAGAFATAVVAVAAWWLLRSPPLPVEARLPQASGVSTTTSGRSATRSSTTTAAGGAVAVGASAVAGGTGGAPTTGPPSTIVVQAVGKVARPGVYHLPADARVVDLVEAAGGVTPDGDAAAVPLAAKLTDGQRVVVPGPGTPAATAATPIGPSGGAPAPAGSGSSGGSGAPTAEAPLDLNAAGPADFDRLPGVGPATAAAIIAYRDAHGPFRTVDDLGEVRGIGPARLEALRTLVTV